MVMAHLRSDAVDAVCFGTGVPKEPACFNSNVWMCEDESANPGTQPPFCGARATAIPSVKIHPTKEFHDAFYLFFGQAFHGVMIPQGIQ